MKTLGVTMHRLATDETARRSVVEAVRAAPNGEVADLDRTIAAYEKKFAMTSAEAVTAIERGELRPTRDIEGWMVAVRVRDHLVKARAR